MKKGWVVWLGAALAALAVLVLFVLPAEFGIDPTGVGARTGLVEMADPPNEELERGQARMGREDVLTLGTAPAQDGATDEWSAELGPFESVEFKYTVPEGAKIAFDWQASGPVNYDMHAHPFDGGEEVTESYGIGEASRVEGLYTAPFTGIHGWYWQNRNLDNVTITLRASGGFTHSTIYSSGAPVDRPIAGVEDNVEGQAAGHEMQDAE